jgi:ABC-type nickel/cobalt efflux system permease component RcnA
MRTGGNPSVKYRYSVTKDLATFGLSLSAGLGLILIIIALAASVVSGDAVATTASLLVTVGIVLMIIGIAGWMVVVQPWRRFDDINVALPDEHGHGAAHGSETAIVAHEAGAHAVEPAQH